MRIQLYKLAVIFIIIILMQENSVGQTSQSFYSTALIDLVSGKNKEAIDGFSKAIALEDTMLDAYFNRGIAYEKIGEYDKAIRDYSTVINFNPRMYQAYNNRGLLYFDIEKYKKAIDDFSRSIALKSDFPFSYLYRSNTYLVMGNLSMAKADAESVLRLLPNYIKAHQILAQIAFVQRDYKIALQHYNLLCKVQNENAANFVGRARVYKALNRFDLACSDFKKAASLGNADAKNELKNNCK